MKPSEIYEIERRMREFQKYQKRINVNEIIQSEEYETLCKNGMAIMSFGDKHNAIFKTLEM